MSSLKAFKGYKRVENYIRQVYNHYELLKNDPFTSREDLEAYQIDRERRREQLEGFKTVERIIASRDAEANADIDHDHGRSIEKHRKS